MAAIDDKRWLIKMVTVFSASSVILGGILFWLSNSVTQSNFRLLEHSIYITRWQADHSDLLLSGMLEKNNDKITTDYVVAAWGAFLLATNQTITSSSLNEVRTGEQYKAHVKFDAVNNTFGSLNGNSVLLAEWENGFFVALLIVQVLKEGLLPHALVWGCDVLALKCRSFERNALADMPPHIRSLYEEACQILLERRFFFE